MAEIIQLQQQSRGSFLTGSGSLDANCDPLMIVSSCGSFVCGLRILPSDSGINSVSWWTFYLSTFHLIERFSEVVDGSDLSQWILPGWNLVISLDWFLVNCIESDAI